MLEVFVDFDGTITDVDTFDALVRSVAGVAAVAAVVLPTVYSAKVSLRRTARSPTGTSSVSTVRVLLSRPVRTRGPNPIARSLRGIAPKRARSRSRRRRRA